MLSTRHAAAGVTGAVVLALLGACGSDAEKKESEGFTGGTGPEIADAAKADMRALETVRLTGDLMSEGSEISLDLGVSTTGDCAGSFGLEGGTAEIVSSDGQTWFRPDEAFWRASSPGTADQIMSMVGDKWVALGEGDETFNEFCNLDSLLDELFAEDSKDEEFTKGETSDVDGTEAIAIEQDADGEPVIGYVAVDSPHYLLKLERQGTDSGTVTFSEFDEDLDIETPSEDEVVDLASLSGG